MNYRIRILGGSGSGKSTLSRRIGKILGIELVIHLDDIFWQPGWQPIPAETLHKRTVERIKDRKSWIIDGNYSKVGEKLDPLATHFVIIHPPLYTNLWRLLIREIMRRLPVKIESISRAPWNVINDKNPDPIHSGLILLMRHATNYYRYRSREKYLSLKKLHGPDTKVFVFHTENDLEKLKTFFRN